MHDFTMKVTFVSAEGELATGVVTEALSPSRFRVFLAGDTMQGVYPKTVEVEWAEASSCWILA